MKKNIKLAARCVFCAALCLVPASGVFARTADDAALYRDLTSAYESRAFPGVIEYASRIENGFPRSLFLPQALTAEGESCFRLGRYEDSLEALEKAAALSGKNYDLKAACSYWAGRDYFELGKYDQAVSCFYKVLAVYKTQGSSLEQKTVSLCRRSVLFAAKACVQSQNYADATSLLEQVVSNGSQYSMSDYSQACVLLFDCYENTGKYDKTISLYASLEKNLSAFDSLASGSITLSAGTAYENKGEYKNAWNCYTRILKNGPASLASTALLKAYNCGAEHKNQIGDEADSILSYAEKSLGEYPGLVNEFYLRLAIDSFEEQKYSKSLQYFDKAEEKLDRNYKLLCGLYRSRIAMEQNPSDPSSALSVLNTYSVDSQLSPSDSLYVCYQEQRAEISMAKKDWSTTSSTASDAENLLKKNTSSAYIRNVEVEKNAVAYLNALADYETGNYSKARQRMEPYASKNVTKSDRSFYSSQVLYSLASAKCGYLSDAEKTFARLEKSGVLDEQDKISYAKTLLLEGKSKAAYEYASKIKTSSTEPVYLCAVASFNRKDWQTAENLFQQCSGKSSTLESAYKTYSLFYLGYCQYRNGKTSQAFKSFDEFVKENPSHELAWTACTLGAGAAVQNGDYDNAVALAEKSMKAATTEDRRQDSVVLAANIYADSGKYDKAVETLSSSVKLQSDFGVRARYQTAQIYAKQGELEKADELFAQIVSSFKSSSYADDSAFRRGEIYYNASRWQEAATRFELYRSQFGAAGKYLDDSYFYSGKSLAENGNSDGAILMYLTLVTNMPNSAYSYNAGKELVALYRKNGEYSAALSQAREIQDKYPEQASKDGIASQISQLKKLNGGEDEAVVKLQDAYENAGGSSTYAGRKAGTDLVEAMYKSSDTRSQAVALAKELLAQQTSSANVQKEHSYAARNLVVVARDARVSGQNKVAAQNYLSAAQYARMGNEHKTAAASLYFAAEAFDSAEFYGDAKSVITEMEKLYPNDEYTARAKQLGSYSR